MKHKIKRVILKIACYVFHFMYFSGWYLTYMWMAFVIFGDAIFDYKAAAAVVSAIAGAVSGGLLYVYILKS